MEQTITQRETQSASETVAGISVNGDQNEVLSVAGDMVIGDTYVQEKPTFYQPSLKKYQSAGEAEFVKPEVDEWIRHLGQESLLIFGGTYRHKLEVIRHCAAMLQQMLEKTLGHGEAVEVLEWYHNSDPQSLVERMEKQALPCLFILPDIAPVDINYDMDRIMRSAKDKHYVLVTTEVSKAQWRLPQGYGHCWFEPDGPSLYTAARLKRYLAQKLAALEVQNPSVMLRLNYAEQMDEWVTLLNTPDKVDIFVQQLSCVHRKVSPERIRQMLSLAQGKDEEVLSHWFHHLLNEKERVLVLGLCFFDGLWEDQCFAALEHVVQSAWLKRDSALSMLDYGDLSNLMNYFEFDRNYRHASGEFSRLRTRIHDQRKKLIETAWHSHRRLILAALPALVDLVKGSVTSAMRNNELYGTDRRKQQLRQVIGETLCDIGRMSQGFVDETLLQLIADNNRAVQIVAAKAMAGWVNHDEVDLFRWLKRLSSERYFMVLIGDIFKHKKVEAKHAPMAYLRSAIVLTISYAAQKYQPNQLDEQLLELFDEMAADKHALVRKGFCHIALPQLLSIHIEQLFDRVVHLCRFQYLHRALASALANAYEYHPQQVELVLLQWMSRAQDIARFKASAGVPTLQEKGVAVAILTYAQFNYVDEEHEKGTRRSVLWGYEKVLAIMTEQQNLYLRKHCLDAIMLLLQRYFVTMSKQLQSLVVNLTEPERQQIVTRLVELYLSQRQQLQGGDALFEHQSKRYPVWLSGERPLTTVEQLMLDWIAKESNPAAAQVAFRTEVGFREQLDDAEAIWIEQQLALELETQLPPTSPLGEVNLLHMRINRFIDRLMATAMEKYLHLATFKMPKYIRQNVASILPIYKQTDSSLRESIVERFGRDERYLVAQGLLKAMELYDTGAKKIKRIVLVVTVVLLYLFN